MAEFVSKYLRLGFYVGDQLRQFSGGKYRTEDAKELEVLNKLSECSRVANEEKEVKHIAEDKPKAGDTVNKKKPSAK